HTRSDRDWSSDVCSSDLDAVGKVISVNQKARYAVLSYSIGALPAIDSRVYAYRNGLKVGELRVSGPQRENNTIADLLSGECQVRSEERRVGKECRGLWTR